MQAITLLEAFVGEWRGTNELFLDPPNPGLSSASTLRVNAIPGSQFVQLAYDWTYESEPQNGVILLGHVDGAASGAWVDSFHMSARVWPCSGTATETAVELRGTYEAPPGPDWGWRITVRSEKAAELQILMHNISPAGQEDIAVRADYTRER